MQAATGGRRRNRLAWEIKDRFWAKAPRILRSAGARAATLKTWAAALLTAVVAATVVALAVGTEPERAAFPGTNGTIVFDNGIQVLGGFGQTRLAQIADVLATNREPDWPAGGQKIAFENTNREVYWINSDGSGTANLTDNAAAGLDPAFFPDYHKIAFASNRDANFEIYVMKPVPESKTNRPRARRSREPNPRRLAPQGRARPDEIERSVNMGPEQIKNAGRYVESGVAPWYSVSAARPTSSLKELGRDDYSERNFELEGV